MKLVTFQTMEALKELITKGYLECSEKFIDMGKSSPTYNWVVEKMKERIDNPYNATYPMWGWVKCYNGIYPPRHKGKPVEGFDVKITFQKDKKDVFITDFRRYSFLLSNTYIPTDLNDKEQFAKKLKELNITDEDLKAYVRYDKYQTHRTDEVYLSICSEIRKSFDRCITEDSNVLQGCVWRINLEDVIKIELVPKDGYCYGSLNYVRTNGKRINWKEDFYHKLRSKK